MDERDGIEYVYGEPVGAPNISVREVLRLTFSVLRNNPLLYLALAFFASLPGLLIAFAFPTKTGATAGIFVNMLLFVIIMGAIAHGVCKELTGENASLGEIVKHGLSRYWSLISLTLVIVVVIMVPLGTGMLVMAVAGLVPGGIALLLALCAVTYVSCVLAVAMPACAVERLSVLESIERSRALTKGHRGSIFCLMLLFGLGAFAGEYLVGLFFSPEGFGLASAKSFVEFPIAAIGHVWGSVLYCQLRYLTPKR